MTSFPSSTKICRILTLALASLATVAGQSWYSSSWSDRKPITINASQVSGGSNLSNFPVLISLASDSSLSSTAQANGYDIVFTDSTGTTKLNHEIESYTASSGQLVAWVQVPTLSVSANTTIYMYYGNPSASNQQNPNGVWDSNFQLVWHLSDSSGGSTVVDSTTNGNTGTKTATNQPNESSGQIAEADFFNGSDAITAPNTTSINIGTAQTISFWVKNDGTSVAWANLGYKDDWATAGWAIQRWDTNDTIYLRVDTSGGTNQVGSAEIAALDGNWHLCDFVLNDGTWKTYLDGSLNSTGSYSQGSGFANSNVGLNLNLDDPSYAAIVFMDEFRLSNSERPAGWIATEYNNQSSPSSFFSVGGQQTEGGTTVPITVTSVPTGLTVTVDGSNCTTPCATLQWTPGNNHTIAAASQSGTTGTQYVFANWSDSGAASHSVTAPSTATTYTASFTTQYLLTTAASPSSEGTISPLSGWYNAGTAVTVTATVDSGNQFTGFSGALTGTTTPQNVTMSGPETVTANFTTSGGGAGWYGSSWSDRKPITINASQVSGGSNLSNFPVLISLASDSSLSSTAQANGYDIVFTDSTGTTKLNHEIESYTASSGQLVAWVQVPTLSASANTTIYMYYGNPSALNQQNPNGVWDSNYKAVFHFSNGTALSTNDSTSNDDNATAGSGVSAIAGEIAGAASLNGTTTGALSLSQALNSSTFTLEAWVYATELDAAENGQPFFYQGTGSGDLGTVCGAYGSNGSNATGVFFYVGGGGVLSSAQNVWPINQWVHVVCVSNSLALTIYINGVASVTGTGSGSPSTNPSYVGKWYGFTNAARYLDGRVDEERVSNTARSAGWIATEYNNQSSPSSFFSVGGQQTSGGGSMVPITVTSVPTGLTVTVDGSNCTTPCATLQWTPGNNHTIAAASQSGTTGTQYVFANWSDSGAASHSVTAPSTATTYTASFTTQYLLTTAASPSSEGTISPLSGWYNAGTAVTVTATVDSGNQFTGFSGALTGTTTPQNVTMSGPETVTANFTTSGGGAGWYGSSWSDRKPITINASQVSGGSNLSNFPVLISLASDSSLSSTAQANGYDIVFTDSTGTTKLNHEIESYTASSGQLVAWVQVPTLSASANTTIYMYYGNPSALNQQNPNGVWDSNYKAVFHFFKWNSAQYQRFHVQRR